MGLDLTAPKRQQQMPVQAPNQVKMSLGNFVKAKVASMMSDKEGKNFATAVVSLANNNPALIECDQTSLVAACLQAQSLGLSIHQGMGQAWIVPFRNNKQGVSKATFQIGYRGYIQLAIRSGQYRKLNVLAIKEGELRSWDPLNEEIDIELIQDDREREKAKTVGYYACFEYINGFKKALYWSVEKMDAYALAYSQAYRTDQRYGKNSSFWTKDFDSMAVKTMLRQLISKWGIMSVDMQNALMSDGKIEGGGYVDGSLFADLTPQPQEDVIDVESTEADIAEPVAQPAPPQPESINCPEIDGHVVTPAQCEKCLKRQGCPSWG